jgi:hypothetical protein
MPLTVSSFFFLLAAGLFLFLLLGPVAGRKKTDFEDDIGRFGIWLSPPFAMQKLPPQAESPSSRNRDNPVVRRKKDDTVDGIGL